MARWLCRRALFPVLVEIARRERKDCCRAQTRSSTALINNERLKEEKQ